MSTFTETNLQQYPECVSSSRIFIDPEDLQTLDLYIIGIEHGDAGRYTCRGEIDDTNQAKSVALEVFSKYRMRWQKKKKGNHTQYMYAALTETKDVGNTCVKVVNTEIILNQSPLLIIN